MLEIEIYHYNTLFDINYKKEIGKSNLFPEFRIIYYLWMKYILPLLHNISLSFNGRIYFFLPLLSPCELIILLWPENVLFQKLLEFEKWLCLAFFPGLTVIFLGISSCWIWLKFISEVGVHALSDELWKITGYLKKEFHLLRSSDMSNDCV